MDAWLWLVFTPPRHPGNRRAVATEEIFSAGGA